MTVEQQQSKRKTSEDYELNIYEDSDESDIEFVPKAKSSRNFKRSKSGGDQENYDPQLPKDKNGKSPQVEELSQVDIDAIDEDPTDAVFPITVDQFDPDMQEITRTARISYFRTALGDNKNLVQVYTGRIPDNQAEYHMFVKHQRMRVFPFATHKLVVTRPMIDVETNCFIMKDAQSNIPKVEVVEFVHPNPEILPVEATVEDLSYYFKAQLSKWAKQCSEAFSKQSIAVMLQNGSAVQNVGNEIVSNHEFRSTSDFRGHCQSIQTSLKVSQIYDPCLEFYLVRSAQGRNASGVYLEVYLNQDAVKSALQASQLSTLQAVSHYVKTFGAIIGYAAPYMSTNEEIPDTNSNVPQAAVAEFGLELRGYQQRTLNWLLSLENNPQEKNINMMVRKMTQAAYQTYGQRGNYVVQLSKDGLFYDTLDHSFSLTDKTLRLPLVQRTIKCNGAILADDTGSGKTITVLALIASNPFKSVKDIPWHNVHQTQTMLPSRASLVICPSHLAQQWKLEAQKVLPKGFRIVMLTTIIEHRKLSWNDILLADLVITTLNFLQNKNYELLVNKVLDESVYEDLDTYMANLKSGGRPTFGSQKGQVLIQKVYWHRLISDEFHELNVSSKTRKASNFFLNELNGRFFLGVTGTPQYKQNRDVVKMAKYLNTNILENRIECSQFLLHRVRRNEPKLELPPLNQELHWINLSAQERGLLFGQSENYMSLMACNHHQLTDQVVQLTGEQNLSVEEVSQLVQSSRLKQVEQLRHQVSEITELVVPMERQRDKLKVRRNRGDVYMDDGVRRVSAEINRLQQQIDTQYRSSEEAIKQIKVIQGQYNFFDAVLTAVAKEVQQQCLICLDSINKDDKFAVPKCGHIYCQECMQLILKADPILCGMCREPIAVADVVCMTMGANQGSKNQDLKWSKYGSKLSELTKFLKELFGNDPKEKVILFIQFRRLTRLVSEALREFGIHHVKCDGNVMQRSKAVREFKTDRKVRLILLSSEDSVSGLHLVEATTVVILHPFLLREGSDALCMSYEKQGVARAYRGGQTHPVRLVRFLVKDTIEETLAVRRNYQHGQITNLEYM